MPKRAIINVFEELLETGKKTAGQMGKIPGGIVEDAAQQTGVRPKTEKEKEDEKKLQKLKQEDEEKKRKDIAFFKRQVAESQPSPTAKPTVREEQEKEERMAILETQNKKGLPPPVMAVKRRGRMGSSEFGKQPGS